MFDGARSGLSRVPPSVLRRTSELQLGRALRATPEALLSAVRVAAGVLLHRLQLAHRRRALGGVSGRMKTICGHKECQGRHGCKYKAITKDKKKTPVGWDKV